MSTSSLSNQALAVSSAKCPSPKQIPIFAWVVANDKVLINSAAENSNSISLDDIPTAEYQEIQPSLIDISSITDDDMSAVLYEIEGVVRLTPDERSELEKRNKQETTETKVTDASKDITNSTYAFDTNSTTHVEGLAVENTTDSVLPLFAISKSSALKYGLIRQQDFNESKGSNAILQDKLSPSLVVDKQGIPERFFDNQGQQHQFISYRALVSIANSIILDGLSQSIQKLRWQADHKFCSRCASPTTAHTVYPAMVCSHCGYSQYPRVQPCVITAIIRKNPDNHKQQLLLAHHHRYGSNKNTPAKKLIYGLIAGFVEAGESLEHAVHRESLEEVGITVDNLRYFTSQPWPYPSNLMVGFIADYDAGNIVIQEDELSHAEFFDIDDLPNIPPKGTIAYTLIHHVITKQPSIG